MLYEWVCVIVSLCVVFVLFYEAGALCSMGDMFNYASYDLFILIDVFGVLVFGVNEGNMMLVLLREVVMDLILGDGVWDEELKMFAFRVAR